MYEQCPIRLSSLVLADVMGTMNDALQNNKW